MTTKLNPYVTLKDVAQTSTNVANLINNTPIKYTQALNDPVVWYDGLHLTDTIGPIIIDSSSFGNAVNINEDNSNLDDVYIKGNVTQRRGDAPSYPGIQIYDANDNAYSNWYTTKTIVSLVLPPTISGSLQVGTKIDVYVLVPPRVNGNVVTGLDISHDEPKWKGYLVPNNRQNPLVKYYFDGFDFDINFGYSLTINGTQVANVPESGIKINGVNPPRLPTDGSESYPFDYSYFIDFPADKNVHDPNENSVAHLEISCVAPGEYLIRVDHQELMPQN
jgi:hypothetical protein